MASSHSVRNSVIQSDHSDDVDMIEEPSISTDSAPIYLPYPIPDLDLLTLLEHLHTEHHNHLMTLSNELHQLASIVSATAEKHRHEGSKATRQAWRYRHYLIDRPGDTSDPFSDRNIERRRWETQIEKLMAVHAESIFNVPRARFELNRILNNDGHLLTEVPTTNASLLSVRKMVTGMLLGLKSSNGETDQASAQLTLPTSLGFVYSKAAEKLYSCNRHTVERREVDILNARSQLEASEARREGRYQNHTASGSHAHSHSSHSFNPINEPTQQSTSLDTHPNPITGVTRRRMSYRRIKSPIRDSVLPEDLSDIPSCNNSENEPRYKFWPKLTDEDWHHIFSGTWFKEREDDDDDGGDSATVSSRSVLEAAGNVDEIRREVRVLRVEEIVERGERRFTGCE